MEAENRAFILDSLHTGVTVVSRCRTRPVSITLQFYADVTPLGASWGGREEGGPQSRKEVYISNHRGEDSHGDHGLGRLVEFRFKAPPSTTSSSITTHTSSGQRNCASWASQPQKSVTLLPCPGGRTKKSTKGHVVALGGGGISSHRMYWQARSLHKQ